MSNSSAPVRIEKKGVITTVILSRPEVRNAVDSATAKALADAFRSFEGQDDPGRARQAHGQGQEEAGQEGGPHGRAQAQGCQEAPGQEEEQEVR